MATLLKEKEGLEKKRTDNVKERKSSTKLFKSIMNPRHKNITRYRQTKDAQKGLFNLTDKKGNMHIEEIKRSVKQVKPINNPRHKNISHHQQTKDAQKGLLNLVDEKEKKATTTMKEMKSKMKQGKSISNPRYKNITHQQQTEEDQMGLLNLADELQHQADEVDEMKQQAMKGNFIISSPNINGKTSIIMSDEELETKGISLYQHMIDLIKLKFGIVIPVGDISSCHRVENGNNVILKIWNRRSDAAYWKLVKAIKKGSTSSVNLIVNFMLTNRRNSLLNHLKKLKEQKKIAKLYVDENGSIYFRIKKKGKNIKATYFKEKKSAFPKTMSNQEIDQAIGKFR